MREYMTIIDSAIAEEASKNWGTASKLYAQAGQSLLRDYSKLTPTDRSIAINTVEIICRIAEELKKKETVTEEAHRTSDNTAASFYPAEKPNIFFRDIAGLNDAKELIKEEILLPRKYPDLFKKFLQNPNGGILLYGPPGTGKTMLARAIATETDASFFSIRCSDIVSKFFGDSERRINSLFQDARKTGNAIIFFDEFEALASKRGSNSTVMNRLIPELLSQMDGFEKSDGRLIVIAATNRPWDLDSAFLRPPRLSHHIYVPLPDEEAREALLRKWIEQVPHSSEIDISALAAESDGLNCADIVHAFSISTRFPIRRSISDGESHLLTYEDIKNALMKTVPSVNRNELRGFDKWLADRKGA